MTEQQINIRNIVLNRCEKHRYEGVISMYQHKKIIFSEASGNYNDIENRPYVSEDYFTISKKSNFFVSTTLLILLEKLKINVEESIESVLPELNHAHKIKYIHLLRTTSGLPDYHGEVLLKHAHTSEGISEEKRINDDVNLASKDVTYEEALDFYNTQPLLYEPGADSDSGDVLSIVGVEVIKRLSRRDYWQTVSESMFLPLGITHQKNINPQRYVNHYYNKKVVIDIEDIHGYIGIQVHDLYRLVQALKEGLIASKKVYQQMKKIVHFSGINFGMPYGNADYFTATPFSMADFYKEDIQIVFASNYPGTFSYEDDDFERIIHRTITNVQAVLLKYDNPKLVKLSKKNVYDLLDIKVSPEKAWFMGSTKFTLAYDYVEKNITTYLLIDSGMTIGVVALYMDKKNLNFLITNVLIDDRFQHRGYGKKMILLALDKLKENGAIQTSLWVDRANDIAVKMYLSAGFSIKGKYPSSYEMHIGLS